MLPYFSVILVIAVYVYSNVSFDLPQGEVASAFSIFVVFLALSGVICTCFENVYLGSNVNPNIFMPLFMESVSLYIVRFRLFKCSVR